LANHLEPSRQALRTPPLPGHPLVSQIRNIILLLFTVTIYAVAPVKGFGWILMLSGIAQSHEDEKAFRIAYLLTFLLIQQPFPGHRNVAHRALGELLVLPGPQCACYGHDSQ
jgi:hypothetical protein